MSNLSRTKIVATIGPSSWNEETLRAMINEGLQVARINASFADAQELQRVADLIRSISPRVTIMIDTKGQKIRVSGVKEDTMVENSVTICSEDEDIEGAIKVTYSNLHNDVTRGTRILMDDGNIHLVVKDIKGAAVVCDVIQGGILKPNKTVNIPDVNLNFPTLTEKDRKDLLFAAEHDYDFAAISFVRNKEDILLVRELIGDSQMKIISKIENQEGIDNFEEILSVSDGIMVARGDLGVETPLEKVPVIQKQLIYKCRTAGKPVIVATQMLESMRENIQPTRAEVSDVANAVMDGADAVMLSAETSTGKHPVEAVKFLNKIALETESVMQSTPVYGRTSAVLEVDELCRYTCEMVRNLPLKGVIVLSKTGKTVASLSRHRINAPIWSISTSIERVRQDSFLRSVRGYYTECLPDDRDNCIQKAVEMIYSYGELEFGDKVAIISGSSIKYRNTNAILEIVNVKDVLER